MIRLHTTLHHALKAHADRIDRPGQRARCIHRLKLSRMFNPFALLPVGAASGREGTTHVLVRFNQLYRVTDTV